MELITIPNSSFVNSAGKCIGIYSDASDWWQKLKLIEKDVEFESNSSMNVKLIKNKSTFKKKSINSICSFEEEKQYDVIGETPLHIAIMYDDLASLKILIEKKGYNVNQRNVGHGTFLGGFNGTIKAKLIEQARYDGLAYYGEYPLALAAYFGNKDIYDYLIHKGADPNLQGDYLNKTDFKKFHDQI